MKIKFPYLYISFIVSLAILVILSFLFYNKLNSHLKYTAEYNDSYSVILELKDLGQHITSLESHSRAFIILKDSSFLPLFAAEKDSVNSHLDSLKARIATNSDQMRRFLLMRSTLINQVNMYTRSIEMSKTEDSESLEMLIIRSRMLMNAFQEESAQIQKAELRQREELFRTKEFFEDFYPNYFNTISIWAEVVKHISFLFINSEVRMPVFATLLNRPINNALLRNFQLVQFVDLGTAWNGTYNKIQRPSTSYGTGNVLVKLKAGGIGPFAGGYGFGARSTLLGYFIRFDAAWEMNGFFQGKPQMYLALGLDF